MTTELKNYIEEVRSLRNKYADDDNAVNIIDGVIKNGFVDTKKFKELKELLEFYFGNISAESSKGQ